MASPAWAAKKVTVQQLKELLVSLQQAKKADADVADELKQVELSEELTRSLMNSLVEYVPAPPLDRANLRTGSTQRRAGAAGF